MADKEVREVHTSSGDGGAASGMVIGIILVAALVVGGFFVWTYAGNNRTASGPSSSPRLNESPGVRRGFQFQNPDFAMTHPTGEHGRRVPDDGRGTAAWTALAFVVLSLGVLALHVVTDDETRAGVEARPPAAGSPRAG